jgi:ATP-dependent helicase/DNAse subunit B
MHQKMERDRVKALNKERQASLKKDMDKLYQLATELKQAVDKTDENMLSVQVVRKTEEIEKLAKNIRQKMRDAY